VIVALAILSLIDIVCTGIGVHLGVVIEANPIAAYLFEWSIVGTCVIFALTNTLLLYILAIGRKRFGWVNRAVYYVAGVKSVIVYLHLYWIALL
jgi:hypothetical protein